MPIYVLPTDNFRIPANGEFGNNAAFREGRRHKGTDDSVPVGTPVRSVIAGTVVDVGYNNVIGNWVTIWGDDGLFWWYCHLSRDVVGVGNRVGTGELIAYSGNTGATTGDHLHIGCGHSISVGVSALDPMIYLTAALLTLAALTTKPVPTPTKEDDDMAAPILILLSTPSQNKDLPAGATDTWLQNIADHTYYHIPNTTQADYLRNNGALWRGNQSPAVLEGFKLLPAS